MALTDLSPAEQTLVIRSAAHCIPEHLIPSRLRFRNGVDDLDAARLLLAVERGTVIVQVASGRSWHTVPRTDRMPSLTRVVEECLRLGLVYRDSVITGPALRRIQLAAAPIHLRGMPCDMPSNFRRVRMLADVRLVDCLVCKRIGQAY